MIWTDKREKYIGQWLNDKQHGIGTQIWYEPRSDQKLMYHRYVGEWKDGKRDGYGVFYFSNGCRFEGTYINNLKEGFGIYTYQDGQQYIGLFENDQMINESNPITEEMIMKHFMKETSQKNTSTKTKSPSNKVKDNNVSQNKKLSIRNSNDIAMPVNNKQSRKNMQVKGELEIISENVNEGNNNSNNIADKKQDKKTIDSNVTNSNNGVNNNSKQTKTNAKNKKNKNIVKFEPFIDLTELNSISPEIAQHKSEIEKIFLRNLTEARRWYLYSTKIEITETEEQKEKRELAYATPPHTIYSNALTNCMCLKDLWRFFRDIGLCSTEFTFANFNRLFYKNPNNTYSMFYVPEEVERFDIYTYLHKRIDISKSTFAYRYKTYIEYYMNTIQEHQTQPKLALDYLTQYNTSIPPTTTKKDQQDTEREIIGLIDTNVIEEHATPLPNSDDIHNKDKVILLRHFYSALLTAAYLKYIYNDTMQFDEKVKNLFALCNASKPQYKRGRGNKSTHSRLETSFINKENQQINEQIKRRNSEYILIDDFTRHNEIKLRPVFYHLYLRSHKCTKHNLNDLTVKYSFFYNKVIKRSELLQQLYESKKAFIEVINHFHRDKQYQSSLSSGELGVEYNNNKEQNAYIMALMDMEFIFYEFVEMVFFICRKYVLRKHLKEEQESYLDLINHLWMIVKIDWVNKEECEKGKFAYVYPKLHTHNKIERLEEEQKMKEENERMKQLEMERFVKERGQLKDEDVNCFVVENKDDDDYSDESEFQ